MRFVILGCGRVGSRIATMLDLMGHTVAIVDRTADSFKRLPADFGGQSIVGIGIDEDVLRSAGIEKADVFAAVTNGDNTNIMASQVAKELFHVPRVIARIYDPLREETYHALGLETLCPTTLISNVIVQAVVPGVDLPDITTAPAGTNPVNVPA